MTKDWIFTRNGWRHIGGKWTHFCVDCGTVSSGIRCADCFQLEVYRNRLHEIEYKARVSVKKVHRSGFAGLMAVAGKISKL